MTQASPRIAVLIPCFNEEITIEKVVRDFRAQLPDADIYVYDNNSTDKTVEKAKAAGAIIGHEYMQGKGNVMRRMFREIDADVYVMVDGDDTYPAEAVKDLISPIIAGRADMVNGDRLSNGSYTKENKRAFHNLGNNLVRGLINSLFKANITDIMTGYRAFSRVFVKNWPIDSRGFEIETEMTIHALDKRFVIEGVPIEYRDRPAGSFSKLNTLRDGLGVLKTIITIFKDYRPMPFFFICALIMAVLGLISGYPVISEFNETHYITHIPLTILAAALEMIAINTFTCGLILHTVQKNEKHAYELRLIDYYDRENR